MGESAEGQKGGRAERQKGQIASRKIAPGFCQGVRKEDLALANTLAAKAVIYC